MGDDSRLAKSDVVVSPGAEDVGFQSTTSFDAFAILSWLAPRFFVLSGSLFQVSLTLRRLGGLCHWQCPQEFLSSHSSVPNGSHWASLLKKFPDLNQVYVYPRICQLLFLQHYECLILKTSTNGSRQQLLLGQPLCPTLGWKPLAHSPRRASSRLGPIGPSSQKEMQANHSATNSWTWKWDDLNQWNSWKHVVYLTILKWKTLGPIDLELVELPGFPCQARFFPCKLLCWPSYLDRSKSGARH